jgi:K+/H+ antiporter YhaU regulatory subunit KhtT
MEAFGRRIPRDILRLAVSVVLWGATIVAVSSIAITQLTESGVRSRHNVTVVGVKSPGKPFTYATEKTVVSNHDLLIVSGTEGDIEKFAALE